METLTSKEELLKIKLIEFYKDPENLNILLPIILQRTKISLRSLDWFVTNYCKKYNINYIINENVLYFPFKSYKSQLKAYSKKFCDPFCRRERVVFDYENHTIIKFNNKLKLGHKNYIITTIGQLNFFKFAIQDNIINYAMDHIDAIEQDMNTTLKSRDTEKRESSEKFVQLKNIKRKELSAPGNKSIHITCISATIKFV